eukprot:TRINITY_DN8891_c0_g1_i1.p1 TRINITY_DN8891_c0_g1~~TRINITY_DN8891_c0_g1_i1.p1  ORF type:complete len:165 (+),score=18.20 TRINITY_DN8891_c0_g1_i1:142-636(+)
MNPEDPCLYTHRGNAYDDKGDWEFAIKDFNTAISLAPDYFYAFHNRGYVLTKRSQWERAYRDYTRALEISPDSATTLSNRGYVSVMKGDFHGAIKDCQRALTLNKNDSNAYRHMAAAYKGLSDTSKAIECLEKSLEIAPDYAAARKELTMLRGSDGSESPMQLI